MRLDSRISIIIILMFFMLPACIMKDNQEKSTPEIAAEESVEGAVKVQFIFYNMYLPTEMSRLFEKTGANYNPHILNSADDFSRYDDNNKIALNIGVYGVDLSYCRIFGQDAATAKYFSTIQILYEKLGIPENYYQDLVKGLEKYYNDKDSLEKFAIDVFDRADQYLRENNNDETAAMIIAGGWIEALYIASEIAESNPENIEIAERIAGQKYSLNCLISLLGNYQENIIVTEYILMLKGLKKTFDRIDIYYQQDKFQLDTINKLISTSGYEVNLSPEILREINSQVNEIRSEVVD